MVHRIIFPEPLGGDVNLGWALLAVTWSLVALALVSTILRIWVRARITRNLSWDDYTMAVAMVRSLCYLRGTKTDMNTVHNMRGRSIHHNRSIEWIGKT